MEINNPEVVAEVTQAFRRYEAALTTNDIPVLEASFWDHPLVIRFALHDNGYGPDAIARARRSRDNTDLRRELEHTVITTFGRDFATAMTEFRRDGNPAIGRQSQTWVRFAAGWRVVAAHVSLLAP